MTFCEHGDEPSGFIKKENFLKKYILFCEYYGPWNYLWLSRVSRDMEFAVPRTSHTSRHCRIFMAIRLHLSGLGSLREPH